MKATINLKFGSKSQKEFLIGVLKAFLTVFKTNEDRHKGNKIEWEIDLKELRREEREKRPLDFDSFITASEVTNYAMTAEFNIFCRSFFVNKLNQFEQQEKEKKLQEDLKVFLDDWTKKNV